MIAMLELKNKFVVLQKKKYVQLNSIKFLYFILRIRTFNFPLISQFQNIYLKIY